MGRPRAAAFRFISADLRRDILRALLTAPLAEALSQAERLGFTPQETTAAIGEAQSRSSFRAWERKI